MCSIYFSIFSMPKKMHITHTHSLWLTHLHTQFTDHHSHTCTTWLSLYHTHIYTIYSSTPVRTRKERMLTYDTRERWWRGRRGVTSSRRGRRGAICVTYQCKINCLSPSGRWNYRDASSFMHIWESKDFETSYTFLRSFNHAINYCLTWCTRFGGTTVGWL